MQRPEEENGRGEKRREILDDLKRGSVNYLYSRGWYRTDQREIG